MYYNLLVATILTFYSYNVLASKEECEALRKEDAEFKENLLALSKFDKDFSKMIRPDRPKDYKPFSDNDKISSIPINYILQDLSGGYCESISAFPIMYFGSGKIIVVYMGFEKEYPYARFTEAVKDYKVITDKINKDIYEK